MSQIEEKQRDKRIDANKKALEVWNLIEKDVTAIFNTYIEKKMNLTELINGYKEEMISIYNIDPDVVDIVCNEIMLKEIGKAYRESVSEKNNKNYSRYAITKYPKIYERTYWGAPKYTDEQKKIVENRNAFIIDYNIKDRAPRDCRTLNDFEYCVRNGYGRTGNYRKYFDHCETYITHDTATRYIFITSPYSGSHLSDVDEFKEKFGFEEIYPMYDNGAITFLKFIDDLKELRRAYPRSQMTADIKNYQMTEYPKIYENTYWGAPRYTDDQKNIVKNRDAFIRDYDIKGNARSSYQILNNFDLYGRNGSWSKYFEHCETYRTHDKKYVFITSLYGDLDCFKDVDEFKDKFGFKEIYPMYSNKATTFVKVIDDLKVLRRAYLKK